MPWFVFTHPRRRSGSQDSILIRGPLSTEAQAQEAASSERELHASMPRPSGEELDVTVIEADDRRQAVEKFFRVPRSSQG